ncbi:MAG TPA: D-2-hydroxyacid dehydrogenase family protein [Stellaceae bacterium]|nr:D-2-hydroxyacid dehydrogenase family protein [Stellaceae bacterium]
MMQVAVLDDYQGAALRSADWQSLHPRVAVEAFPEHIGDEAALARRLHPFECVVLMRERTQFRRGLIEKLPNLRLIISAGMRNAALDVDAATERKIQVCGTDMLGYPTAELAWGLIIAVTRHIPLEDASMRQGGFQTQVLGNGLQGKTLGILGLGRLGSQVARVGKAFGMNLVAWSPNLTAEKAAAEGAKRVSKEELFSQSDVITIHVVLSPRSRGLVGAADLGRMKRSAYLVNTSRGPIIDEAALLDCLKNRRIAGAALDVYDIEPLPKDHALRKLDTVVLTPHLGYGTEEAFRQIYSQAVETIGAFLDGKVIRPINTLA